MTFHKKDYEPFGKEISGGRNRTGFINKGKDNESALLDIGVRKYDSEIGRFTSCDPLAEKYYSLTPYQYSANNPVGFKDADGRIITKVDFIKQDQGFYDYAYQTGKSWNSPTINGIIEKAEGANSSIFIKFMRGHTNVQDPDSPYQNSAVGETSNHCGYTDPQNCLVTLESRWNLGDYEVHGKTMTTKQGGDMVADCMLSFNLFSSFQLSTLKDNNVLAFFDELNHAVSSLPASDEKNKLDHISFFGSLLDEDEKGIIKLPWEIKGTIKSKYEEAVNKEK